MSVRYKKFQNKIQTSKSYGKWYGRAVSLGTVTTADLAEEISHSTTVTKADINAVLTELAEVMSRHLLNSQAVNLNGIGTFRVGFKSVPTEKKEDFKASQIKSFHISYSAQRASIASYTDEKGKVRKVYVKDLLTGVTAEELPANYDKAVVVDDGGDAAETGSDTEQNNG